MGDWRECVNSARRRAAARQCLGLIGEKVGAGLSPLIWLSLVHLPTPENKPMRLVVDAKTIAVDEDGYLACAADWNPQVAAVIACGDDCELSPDHWEVIHFLREYYAEHQMTPAMRVLTQAIAKRLGHSKGNTRYLYQLYPAGPTKQATRYAGLPKPISCI